MDRRIEGPLVPPPGSARPVDYVFLLRPTILIPVWTFYLLGAAHSAAGTGGVLPSPQLLTGLASFTALLGSAYILNQIYDRVSDLANNKLFLVSHGIIGLRAAFLEAVLLAAASMASAWLLMPRPFFTVVTASLLLGVLYSAPPVRLKRRPFLDILANAAGSGLLNTAAGWIAAGGSGEGYIVLLPYPLAVAAVHLVTTVADLEGDSRAGLRTTGVFLGRTATMASALGCMAAASAAAAWVDNRPAMFASLLSLPFFIVPTGKKKGGRRQFDPLLPAKASTVIFSAAAAFFFPLYLPFAVLVLLLTRAYYRRRFSMEYPSL